MDIIPHGTVNDTTTSQPLLDELIANSKLDRPIIWNSIRQSLNFFDNKMIDTKYLLQAFEKSLQEKNYFYLNNALVDLYIEYIKKNNSYLLTINNNTQDDINHVLNTYINQKKSFLLKHQKGELSLTPFPFSPDDLVSEQKILGKISKISKNISQGIISFMTKK